MKIKNILLLIIITGLVASLVGCGSTPSKDDSDIEKTMEDVVDTCYYTLTHLKGRVETDTETTYSYSERKFITHERDITLNCFGEEEEIYAFMELTTRDYDIVDTKDASYEFYVVFDDGHISKVVVDQNLLDESVTYANVLSEQILCIKDLKMNESWYSSDGSYSVVEKFEYVVIDEESRTAQSYRIVTYTDHTKSKIKDITWWTPRIGWFCQQQEYVDGEKGDLWILTDIDFDWEDDEI